MSIDRTPPPCHLTSWTKEDQPSDGFFPHWHSQVPVQNVAKQEVQGGKSCSVAVGEEKRERKNEGERVGGKDRGQGWGCMYSWSPQSTVRGRMTRIQGKLGHVEKYSCNDPSSIICLLLCIASSLHFPSKPAKGSRFNTQTLKCFWDFPSERNFIASFPIN